MRKKSWKNHTFHYLTKTLGKKSALHKLQITNPLNKTTRTTYDRKEIESLLTQHNIEHFSKAKKTPAYNDKIIKNLHKEEIRDKILKGKLQKEDVDDDHVYEFLKLLQNENKELPTKEFRPMALEHWRKQ